MSVFADDLQVHQAGVAWDAGKIVPTPTNGGIKEIVAKEFLDRYSVWKTELLSTEFGRTFWETYSEKQDFILIIKVSGKSKKGASTADFLWNEDGQLVGATVNLGGKLDSGLPDPIYYPVMNSITEFIESKEIDGATVAATKFAHEFGHVDLTLRSNHTKVKLENQLIPQYNLIFLKNGFNTNDRQLLEIAEIMGGTPTRIWENREYWGEVSSMNFLLQRTEKMALHCDLINKINDNINRFSKAYKDRFAEVVKSSVSKTCGK
jgi:hypothetical protein